MFTLDNEALYRFSASRNNCCTKIRALSSGLVSRVDPETLGLYVLNPNGNGRANYQKGNRTLYFNNQWIVRNIKVVYKDIYLT